MRHQSMLHSSDSDRRDFIKNVLNRLPGSQSKIDALGRERLGETYITIDRLLNEE